MDHILKGCLKIILRIHEEQVTQVEFVWNMLEYIEGFNVTNSEIRI